MIFISLSFFNAVSFAQNISTVNCNSNITTKVNYPEDAEGITGTVIVEWETDSSGMYKNPVIIKSLGKSFDEVALSAVNELIKLSNNCTKRCRLYPYEIKKRRFAFIFTSTDDD